MGRKTRGLALVLALVMLATAIPVTVSAYSDVPSNYWAADKINEWTDLGHMDGYPDGTFKPEGNITRAEFVKITNRAFGFTAATNVYFTDLTTGHWGYQEIRVARAQGYINGYPDGTFRPNDNISRQEAAKIICTILGLAENPSATYNFNDWENIDAWARGFVGAVYANKLMGCYSDGTFKARQKLTRAECVDGLWNGVQSTSDPKGADYVLTEAKYNPTTTTTIKNLTIRYAGDVDISNVVVEGNIIIDKRVDDFTVTLRNSRVLGSYDMAYGNLVLDGATLYSLDCSATKNGRTVTLKNLTNVTRATTDRSVTIDQTALTTSAKGIETLYVGNNTSGAKAVLKGVFPKVIVSNKSQNIVLATGTIKNLESDYTGLDLLLGQSTVLEYATLAASSTRIEGPGTVTHAYVDSTGVTFQRYPTQLSGPRSPSGYSGDWKLGFTVTDANSGKAVGGAKVVLGDGWATGTTDSKGYIEFANMPNRAIDYTITVANFAEKTDTVAAGSSHRYPSVALTPTGSWRVELIVTDNTTAKTPLQGASATIINKNGTAGQRAFPSSGSSTGYVSNNDGKLYFEKLGNSEYTAKVMAPGHVSQDKKFTVNGKNLDAQNIPMVPNSVVITAVDESTRKADGSYSSTLADFRVIAGGKTYTSAGGKVTVTGLPSGSQAIRVVAYKDGKPDEAYMERTMTINVVDLYGLTTDQQKTANQFQAALSVSETHNFTVLVRNWDGSGVVQGATVTLTGPGGWAASSVSDATGYAAFSAVPKNSYYKITATKSGYQSYAMDGSTYQVIDSTHRNAVISMVALRTLDLTVQKGGQAIANMTVILEAKNAAKNRYTGVTNGSGKVSIASVPEGEYTLLSTHDSYSLKDSALTVSDTGTTATLEATDLIVNFYLQFSIDPAQADKTAGMPTRVTLVPVGGTEPPAAENTKDVTNGVSGQFSLPKGSYTIVMEGNDGYEAVPATIQLSRDHEGKLLPVMVMAKPAGDDGGGDQP